jgi:hypothetical protein
MFKLEWHNGKGWESHSTYSSDYYSEVGAYQALHKAVEDHPETQWRTIQVFHYSQPQRKAEILDADDD